MVRQPPPRMALATLGLTLRVNLKTHSRYEKLSLSCDQPNGTFIHESKTVIDKFSTNAIYCGMMTMMYFHPSFNHYRVCQTHPCGFLLSFYNTNYLHLACSQVCSTREKEYLSESCNGPGHFWSKT